MRITHKTNALSWVLAITIIAGVILALLYNTLREDYIDYKSTTDAQIESSQAQLDNLAEQLDNINARGVVITTRKNVSIEGSECFFSNNTLSLMYAELGENITPQIGDLMIVAGGIDPNLPAEAPYRNVMLKLREFGVYTETEITGAWFDVIFEFGDNPSTIVL